MLRSGSCSRCGECCRPDPTASSPIPEFTAEELAAPERIEGYCPLFRREEDGRSVCLGHGTHPFYLSGCDRHPRAPADLVPTPSCSYVFSEAP